MEQDLGARGVDDLTTSEKRLIYPPIAIQIISGKQHSYHYINDHTSALFNLPGHEIIGKSCIDFFPLKVFPELQSQLDSIYATGQSISYSRIGHSFSESSTTPGCYNICFQPLEQERQQIMVTIIDITESTEIEFQLSDLEQRYKLILESSREHDKQKQIFEAVLNTTKQFIGLYDKETRVITLNENTERLLNISKQQVIGKTFVESFPNMVGSVMHKALLEVLNGGALETFKSE